MKQIALNFLEKHNGLLERIREKKAFLDKARPLSANIAARLKEEISLEWTYNSNGIEGNSLTLVETKIILQDGITVGGKSLREHFEAINHNKAIQFLEELVMQNMDIRAIDLLSIHALILKNIEDEFAGRIRNGMVRIVGANFTPPSPLKVGELLDELIDEVNQNVGDLTPLVLAAYFHHRFVWIHPFFDGNGRTARLGMNLILIKNGYPPCIILKNDRKKYYDALSAANKGNYEKLCLMIFQGVERSLNIYQNVLPKAYKVYEPIANVASEPEVPYNQEYLSLLARRGKINAHKEGRVWVTSKADILEYMEGLTDAHSDK